MYPGELEKVYLVTFIQYTNYNKDTVYSEESNKYLYVGREGFLVLESELEEFRQFGNGYRDISLVGQILVESEQNGIK